MRTAMGERTALLGSNVHYFYYDTEYFFQSVSRCGFQHVELYLGTPHLFIDSQVIDDFDCAAKLAEKYGVRIAAVHPETISFRYGLCYLDDRWNEKSLACYRNSIDYAHSLGVHRMNLELTGVFNDQDRNSIFRRAADNLRQLSDYGEERGVRLAVESTAACDGGLITSSREMKSFLQEADRAHIDVNINWEAVRASGESCLQWLEAFGGRCRAIRVADAAQYASAAEELHGICFDGDVLYYPTDEICMQDPAAADRNFLCRIGGKGEA